MIVFLMLSQIPTMSYSEELSGATPISPTTILPMITTGSSYSTVLTEGGEAYYWGAYYKEQEGGIFTHEVQDVVSKPSKVNVLSNIKALAYTPDTQNGGVIKEDGSVWVWGSNGFGQWGTGMKSNESRSIYEMEKVPGLNDVKMVVIGRLSIALKEDGTVWTWGSESDTSTGYLEPHAVQKVAGLENIVQVASGEMFNSALQDDGTVWNWGSNVDGRLGKGVDKLGLGYGLTTGESGPYPAATGNVVKIAVGDAQTLALKEDGTVSGWGSAAFGMLPKPEIVDLVATPTLIEGLTDIIDISIGKFHAMALNKNGEVITWGTNTAGELGNGTKSNSIDEKFTPTIVKNIPKMVSIQAGKHFSLSLDEEGNVWSWGRNSHGELGRGTTLEDKDTDATPQMVQGVDLFSSMTSEGFVALSGRDATSSLQQRDYENIDNDTLFSDPIDTASGALLIQKSLLRYSGVYPFEFGITYNSLLTKKGVLGKGWAHHFEAKLQNVDSDNIKVKWNQNQFTEFTSNDNNTFKPLNPNDKYTKLEKYDNGFILHFKSNKKMYFSNEGLLDKEYVNDLIFIDYTYDSESKLISVKQVIPSSVNTTDIGYGVDRIFTFEYNSDNLVSKIIDNNYRNISFTYDSNFNLSSIIDANGNKTTYTYNRSGQILTGTDNEGTTYLTNEYDDNGRIVKQYDSNNNFSTLSYDEESKNGFIITTVTNREGEIKKLTHDRNYNLTEVVDGLGNTKKQTFDSKRNILTITDENENTVSMAYDEFSNLVSITDPLGRKTLFEYDTNNNLTKFINAKNEITTFAYNENNKVISQVDSKGNKILYNYLDEFLVDYKDNRGNITKFSYLDGNLRTITKPSGETIYFKVDYSGKFKELKDFNGNITSLSYDKNDNLIRKIDALKHATSFSYDSHNEVSTINDAKGILSTFKYDKNGNLISQTRKDRTTLYEYDKEDRLVKSVSPKGSMSTFSYDQKGRLLEQVNPEGIKTSYKYDAIGNVISRQIGGTTETFQYDKSNNLLAHINGNGYSTNFVYNELNQIIEKINAKGNKTFYSYDTSGSISSITDALGHTVSFKYDENDNLIELKDAKGNITSYVHNENNQLEKEINPLLQTTTFKYDLNGNLIEAIDPLSNVSKFSYDKLNRLNGVTDSIGRGNIFQYDDLGYLTGVLNESGVSLYSIYRDDYNNPTFLVNNLDGYETTNTFDSDNNLISTQDDLGRTTRYDYDKLGRITNTNDANSVDSKTTYNQLNKENSYSDPNNNVATLSYDKVGQLLEEVNSTGNGLAYEYDETGNPTKLINGRKQETIYSYDSVDNLIKHLDSVGEINYSYDSNYNLLTVKETKGDNTTTIFRDFDPLNRLIKYTDEFGNVIKYEYDAAGNLIKLIYPDNKIVTYDYNQAGDLTSVKDWNGKTTSYEYNNDGNLISTNKPDGSKELRTYDPYVPNQLTKLENISSSGAIISSTSYRYDSAGNIIYEGNNRYSFKYDNLNRLLSGNNSTYTYDKAGNLLTSKNTTVSSTSKTYTYGADNQLKTFGVNSMEYDSDGNLLTIPLKTSILQGTYDTRNRLTNIGTTSYSYSAENRRTSVTENGKTSRFVINPNTRLDQVLMETDSQGNPSVYYVYGLGLISQENIKGNTSYFHYDRRGSTVALTNETGIVTDNYKYDFYGEILSKQGTTPTRFLYNGKYGVMTDSNGLYYMRTRYYNPEIKRFINRDVLSGDIFNPQTFNRYAYVNGNPVSFIDPFGLSREEDSLGKAALDFLVLDDWNTLTDPNDTFLNHFIAAEMLLINFIPGGGQGLKVALKGKKGMEFLKFALKSQRGQSRVPLGSHFIKQGRKLALQPNVSYIRNGYNYGTDHLGRISQVTGDLQLQKAKRNPYAQKQAGREDRLQDDHGGHLIASMFNGSGDLDNLVPMDGLLNTGKYLRLEESWQKSLKAGHTVSVDIKPIYTNDTLRPNNFEIRYQIRDQLGNVIDRDFVDFPNH